MYDGPEYRLLIYQNGAEHCLLDIVDYTINGTSASWATIDLSSYATTTSVEDVKIMNIMGAY